VTSAILRYEMHPDVLWIERPDGTSCLVHMDGNTSRVDALSTEILHGILAVGSEAAAIQTAERYNKALDVVCNDVADFERELCRERVLLRVGHAGSLRRALSRLACHCAVSAVVTLADCKDRVSGFRATALLTGARLLVAQFGWARTIEAWEARCPQPPSPRDREAPGLLDNIDATVCNRSARSFLNHDCKERSLVCLALARRAAIRADLVIGLSFVPFRGHVWVECGERVIGDELESRCGFDPVMRYDGASGQPCL
jgi:Transglutaminase-like superfamily